MKDSFLRNIITMVVLTLLACFAVSGPTEAGDRKYKINVPSQMPVSHPITQAMDLFCEKATENANGRLVLNHFPAGQLMGVTEIPRAISQGTLKMAQTHYPWWMGTIPELGIYGGEPFDDVDHFLKVARGPLGEYMEKLFAEKGHTKVIAPLLLSVKGGFSLNRPFREIGDMTGMKIRVSTRQIAPEVIALGGVPTVMSSSDTYMALQRNTIQGAHSSLGSIYARKWFEVAKYIFLPRILPTDFHIIANLEWFNNLPPDLQEILMDAGKEASYACTKMALDYEEALMKKLVSKKVEIYEVSKEEYKNKFAPLIEPAINEWAIEQYGIELVNKYNSWVREARTIQTDK